ncbi:hypothetical protein MTO96_040489 [Rhipicephalus appendiculatus]
MAAVTSAGPRGQKWAISSSSMAQGSLFNTSEGSRDAHGQRGDCRPVWPELNILKLLKKTRLLVQLQ